MTFNHQLIDQCRFDLHQLSDAPVQGSDEFPLHFPDGLPQGPVRVAFILQPDGVTTLKK